MGFHLSVHFDFMLLDSLVSCQVFCRNFTTECKLSVEHGKVRIAWVVHEFVRKE